jgi:Zn-dependent alcohol dehydrogenase
MVAAGVCHSDLHVVEGAWRRPADVVLGHEGAAIIEALGPGVIRRDAAAGPGAPGLREGDLVALAWLAPCGTCPACRRGEAWVCQQAPGADHRLDPAAVRLRRPDGRPVGAYSGIGTFCTRQVVAAGAAIPLDPRTPPEVAALIGCAGATGVGAVRNTAGVRAGESVVIVGLGGVGLTVLLAALAAGASPVIGVDREPGKRALALEWGAGAALPPEGVEAAMGDLPSGGADHVLECIGSTETVELAVRLVRPGGTVTLVGMTPMDDRAALDVYRLVESGARLLGSHYGSSVPARDFPTIAADVLAGALPLGRVITATIGLHEVDAALAAMRRREGARRVVLF